MNKNAEKRIIAFTSQSLKEYGIHAVRMDDIAQNMSMSKRTIYQTYITKDNLIYICLQSYRSRMMNMFRIISYDFRILLNTFGKFLKRMWKICIRQNVSFGLTFHGILHINIYTIRITVYGRMNWRKPYWPARKKN